MPRRWCFAPVRPVDGSTLAIRGPATPVPPHSGTGPLISADLLRFHRNSLSHLLVVGGSPSERSEVALEFHRVSPVRLGPLIAVDCSIDEARLRDALTWWMSPTGRLSAPNALWSAERGTLFLDLVGQLSRDTQQLLLTCINRHSALSAGCAHSWTGRLAVGSDEDPWDLVAGGRFLGALVDALDKIRVELEPLRQGGAA